jgi:hypothetical protein
MNALDMQDLLKPAIGVSIARHKSAVPLNAGPMFTKREFEQCKMEAESALDCLCEVEAGKCWYKPWTWFKPCKVCQPIN